MTIEEKLFFFLMGLLPAGLLLPAWFQPFFAYCITVGFFILIYLVFLLVTGWIAASKNQAKFTQALLILFNVRFILSAFFLLFVIVYFNIHDRQYALLVAGLYFFYLALEGYWSFLCGKRINLK